MSSRVARPRAELAVRAHLAISASIGRLGVGAPLPVTRGPANRQHEGSLVSTKVLDELKPGSTARQLFVQRRELQLQVAISLVDKIAHLLPDRDCDTNRLAASDSNSILSTLAFFSRLSFVLKFPRDRECPSIFSSFLPFPTRASRFSARTCYLFRVLAFLASRPDRLKTPQSSTLGPAISTIDRTSSSRRNLVKILGDGRKDGRRVRRRSFASNGQDSGRYNPSVGGSVRTIT